MAKLLVEGGNSLQGRVYISGAKNAILPVLAASLLSESPCRLGGVPDLEDVKVIQGVLQALGARVCPGEATVVNVDASGLASDEPPADLVGMMRASFLVAGPLLARLGRVRVSLPGGCAIGSRPIDLHLKGFAALGAEVDMDQGAVNLRARRLCGDQIYLDYPSVGATENIMMAAVLARGETVIENAAEEPEVVDLARFLSAMGADIKGAGTKVIRVQGVLELSGADYTVIPDRIEAGTYMAAAIATRGNLYLKNVLLEHVKPIVSKMREMGACIEETDDGLWVGIDQRPRSVHVKTWPYPGFPTDMQAQMSAVLAVARGSGLVTETVFENRFMHVDELCRMGADIYTDERGAVITGVEKLQGAAVQGSDLRASAALVVAGLAAEGVTEVHGLKHLDRGYVCMEDKLAAVGARVSREELESEVTAGEC